jgi:hypothetical protein
MKRLRIRNVQTEVAGSVIKDGNVSCRKVRLYFTLLALFALLAPCGVHAQAARRIAIISGNGPLERANPVFALGEDRVTKALEAKLVGQPGITVIAQDDIQAILATQNLQNSDRTSADTATRIGKILNAELIVIVNLANASQSSHQENTPVSQKTMAVVQAETMARLINVESGVNVAEPRSTFEESAVATEVKTFPILKTTGPGLQAALNDLWTKATDSLTTELATKLEAAVNQTSPGPAQPAAQSAPIKVIGMDGGSVFIDTGSAGGVKVGDHFQILRIVATSLKNKDGSPVTRTQPICTLVIDSVSDKNASGKCPNGQPLQDDIAQPAP